MNVSIIIPVYNEDESLEELSKSIKQTFSKSTSTWEIVFVDDGSTDDSLSTLEDLANANPQHARVVTLRRNFGQTAAIAAGIDHSQGEVIVLLDADMQNDPADIPMLLDKIKEGFDVVSGWRVDRKDRFLTRILPSRLANWLISVVTGVRLHDYGCTLKAYKREVLSGFRLYGEMHRFIPAYAANVGAKISEVPVKHHARKFGKTKYGLERTIKVILDLLTVKFLMSYSAKPIYLFGGTGGVLIGGSILTLIFLMIRRLLLKISVFDSPLFQMSTLFAVLGFQSILMGLIAELLVRTYHESQEKPIYTVRAVINPLDEA